MEAKYFPVFWNGYKIGYAPTNQAAWKLARPCVGHPDFEMYFDGGELAYFVYDPNPPA